MKPRRSAAVRAVRSVARVLRDRRGGTAIEYGLIAALIVITLIVGLVNLAGTTVGMWNTISATVSNAH